MKTIVIDSLKIIENHMKEQAKLYPFCFIVWYPGEECIWPEVCRVVKKDIETKDDVDGKIVVIPAQDLEEMNQLWESFQKEGIHHKAIAYKKGKQFTF